MAVANFPANFPNGPIVDPATGLMAPGLNGTYFFLALFNRTGGPGGVPLVRRTAFDGLTAGMLPGSRRILGPYVLPAEYNRVTYGPALLPKLTPGDDIWVWNDSSLPIEILPFAGAKINKLAPGAPFSVPADTIAWFQVWDFLQVVVPLMTVIT